MEDFMPYEGTERRACVRFKIPGATASYSTKKLLLADKDYDEEFCPVVDISRGGIRFLCQKSLERDSDLFIKIRIPGERVPFDIKGKVRWISAYPQKSYKNQVGIQFNPYGEKEDNNYPGILVKIISLEQKFSMQEKTTGEKGNEKFEVNDK